MNDKMEIWNAVCKTDPKHTKQVNQRGGFTSIDAMYQVQRATEQFGPVGDNWWYKCEHSTLDCGDRGVLAFCDLTLFWSRGEDANYFGPVRGCNALISDKGRLDEDAPKKAMTDALTKALSHLGFSADVFLGLFDDNKYVAKRKQEEEESNRAGADMSWVMDVILKLKTITDKEEFEEKVTKLIPHLANRDERAVAAMMDHINQQRGKLNGIVQKS